MNTLIRHLILLTLGTVTGVPGAVQSQPGYALTTSTGSPLTACTLPSPMGEFQAFCGRIPVPEDPARPDGRQIELNVVMLPALEPGEGAVPLFELAGGPGIGVTAAAGLYAGPLQEYRRHRPVVLVDRRGTGESNPLRCSGIEHADPLGPVYPLEAVRACRDELSAHADLDQYGTEVAALDLDHVRQALGFERIDLWGLSYGTVLGQVYLKRFPERVRSAVFVGVAPIDFREPLHRAAGTQRTLDLLFDACRADPACHGAFPDLRADWAAVLQRLDSGPVRVQQSDPETGGVRTREIRRDPFAEEIGGMMGTTSGQRALPWVIHRAAAGDFEPFLERLRTGPSPYAEGLYLSVACPQWTGRIDPAEVEAHTADTFLGDYRVREWRAACAEWPTRPAPEDLFPPPDADVPVLVIAGEMDHATPPRFGAELCAGLPRCGFVSIPHLGHSPFDLDAWTNGECFDRLAIDFFARPEPNALDTSCVASMAPPPFVVPEAPRETEVLGLLSLSAPLAASRAELPDADGWQRAAPDDVGLDASRLAEMTEAIRRQEYVNIHAVLIEKDGRLVYEEYFEGEDQRWGRPIGHVVFTPETLHDVRSATKSVVSALVGIAIASGHITSVDQPLFEFFPEHADLATAEKQAITLRHVLTMSAGFEWDENIPYSDERNDEIRMSRSDDPTRFVLSRPLTSEPGALFNYSGGLTHLLAAVVQRATGQPITEYAREKLFEPLGITELEWLGDLGGLPAAASGLRLRPRDLAKLGSLYLNEGRWQNRKILPAEWVRESTRWHLPWPDSENEYGTHGYGYQWWHSRSTVGTQTIELISAVGNGEQRIFVLPALRMVVTVNAGRYNDASAGWLPEQLLFERILPAVRDLAHAGTPAIDLGAVAVTVARRSARVQPGELVWITGGSDDVPFMERLAVAVGAEGGHPVVTVSSDEMLRRWYQEVPERFDAQRHEWLWRLHELADVVIRLQSTDFSIYAEIPPERLAAWDAANAGLLDLTRRRGSRVVRIGNGLFPSDWRARMLGVDRAGLERAFWAGLLAEPAELAAAGERLRKVLRGASTVRVQHPNGTDLTVGIGRGHIVVTDGTTSLAPRPAGEAAQLNMTWLPGGEVTLALDPERAEGRLVVERFFFDGQAIGPFTLTYSGGRMQALESDGDLSILHALLDPDMPLSDRLTGLKFGVNPHVTDARLLPWMGAGVFSLSMGSNVLLGGDLELPFYFFFTLPGATVHVDDRVVVRDGVLAL